MLTLATLPVSPGLILLASFLPAALVVVGFWKLAHRRARRHRVRMAIVLCGGYLGMGVLGLGGVGMAAQRDALFTDALAAGEAKLTRLCGPHAAALYRTAASLDRDERNAKAELRATLLSAPCLTPAADR